MREALIIDACRTPRGRGKMDAGTFWARHVKGDTMLLQLVRSASPSLTCP